jgi:hypothetical protein
LVSADAACCGQFKTMFTLVESVEVAKIFWHKEFTTVPFILKALEFVSGVEFAAAVIDLSGKNK